MIGTKPEIVIVTNVYFPALGGITSYVKSLADVLTRRGYRMRILSYPYFMIQREDAISNRIARRLVHELAVLAFTLYALSIVLRLRLSSRPVIVHSQSASFCLSIGVIAKLLGARAVHTFHSPIDRCTLRLKSFLPFADVLVCVSKEHREQYIARCGIPRESTIVPGGVDCEFFYPIPEEDRKRVRAEVMASLGLKDEPGPLVLFVGRIVRQKGVGILFDAAKIVTEEFGNATFVLIGPIDQSRAYAADAESLRRRIEPGMRFFMVGKMDYSSLSEAYRMADVLALPSLWEEALGLVAVEAMASGLPVVASRLGGLKSIVTEDVNGHLVEPGEPRRLAEAILDLLRHPDKRARMRLEARALAEAKYSVRMMADKYEEIYSSVLAS